MTVGTDHPPGTDHPIVSTYLARLSQAAATLPPGRREELIAEIRAHIDEALAASGGDDVAVRQVLDRLGAPEDIVAAERADTEGQPGTSHRCARCVTAGSGPPPGPRSPWGAIEILAVLALTVGAFIVPILGPLVGAALAWGSSQWTRAEKWIATALAVMPIVVLALGAAVVISTGVPEIRDGADESVPVEPVPSISATIDAIERMTSDGNHRDHRAGRAGPARPPDRRRLPRRPPVKTRPP